MKFFYVEVGRYTRRGNFETYFSKAVSAPDEYYLYNVSAYFEKRYEGFEVHVDEIKEIEDLTNLIGPSSPPAPKTSESPCLKDFRIKYTEDEKKLHNEYVELTDKADSVLSYLEQSINGRYERLFYTRTHRESITLVTDRYGTECKRLPIKANAFIKSAIDCDEGFLPDLAPEPEITVMQEFDPDMPF